MPSCSIAQLLVRRGSAVPVVHPAPAAVARGRRNKPIGNEWRSRHVWRRVYDCRRAPPRQRGSAS
eukprot:11792604-Alexandrium_andersonii.AAC.1